MKKRIIGITVTFSVLILLVTGFFYVTNRPVRVEDEAAKQVVALNEIEQLAKQGDLTAMSEKIADMQRELRKEEVVEDKGTQLFIIAGIAIAFVVVVFTYVYVAILRPFDKMKAFAGKIAQGNFDVPLEYERSNYFGAFTWAFDSMRREITKARSCEKEAIENNKTVIATLSHDIKTPIASIRAYAEGLEANMDTSPEKRAKYLNVMMKKCDEVSKLTNDLFLHSLSDLDKLKMNPEEIELSGLIDDVVEELTAKQRDVQYTNSEGAVFVMADANRLTQVLENLINNARKYAKSEIDITLTQQDGQALICVRDHGNGIPDEDVPFIFDKFYRGKNCGDEQGSGLGLYIVKYIMEQMQGSVSLYNHDDGLEVTLSLPLLVRER
ncbi:MAG: HAMP domain-containing histidine kinase [Lachnospiraceae bacterium]|nr:HAMP domain-containing histidine kinase [Lachnospiraceae bacterium]